MGNVADHPERLGVLADAFNRHEIGFAVDDGGRLVLVRARSVLVDVGTPATAARRSRAAIKAAGFAVRERDDQRQAARSGIVVVDVPNEVSEVHNEARFSVTPVRATLEALRAQGLVAEPNHVVLGSQTVRASGVGAEAHFAGGMMFTAEIVEGRHGKVLKSASDPAAAPDPATLPAPLALPDRPVPRVLILDTGLRTVETDDGRRAEHEYLRPVRIHSPWLDDTTVGAIDDEDEFDDDDSGTLDFEAGHGTFIAGVIHQVCPDAEIHVGGVLSSFGDGDVGDVLGALEAAIGRPDVGERGFDIVVLSFGGYMADDDGDLFAAGLDRLLGSALAVSAAGNQSTSRPYFPAALPGIVGVGGLAQNERAWFTNFGGWVDACAPAIDVISTFFETNRATGLDEPPFTGWARWSGTSFAAPKVAGSVAQDMYLHGGDAKQAWKRLSDHKRYRFPDLGTVFNV